MDYIVYNRDYNDDELYVLDFEQYMSYWFEFQCNKSFVVTKVFFENFFQNLQIETLVLINGALLKYYNHCRTNFADYLGTYYLNDYLMVDYYEDDDYLFAFIYSGDDVEYLLLGAIIYHKE